MPRETHASYAQSLFQAFVKLVLGEGVPHEAAIIPVQETAKVGASVYQDRKGNGNAVTMRVSDVSQWEQALIMTGAKCIHRITDGKRSGKIPDETMSRAKRYFQGVFSDPTVADEFVSSLDLLIRSSKGRGKTPLLSLVLSTEDGIVLPVKILSKDEDEARTIFGATGFTVSTQAEWKAAHPVEKKQRQTAADTRELVDSLKDIVAKLSEENAALKAANFTLSRNDSDAKETLPLAANG